MSGDRGYQAFRLLQTAFVVAPIVAGLDKFFNLLTQWSNYLSPMAPPMIMSHVQGFMMFVGVVEVVVGLGVWRRPKIFSWLVALWLLCIIVNLVSTGHYFDIALRDLGLFLAALALARLSAQYAEA